MKLEEIIKTIKHDVDYFQTCGEPFQRGRLWEAQKILDMLYKLEPAQLQQHGVMQAEGSDSAKEAAVGKERRTQSQCDGIKHSPFSIKGLDGIIRCADCGTQLYPRGTP